MKERLIREFFGSEKPKDKEKLAEIGKVVSNGLMLEEGTPLSYLKERYQMVGVISNTLYEATEFLGVDMPQIGLLFGWFDKTGSRKYIVTSAATEKGIIKFSPDYLRRIAKGLSKNGIGSKTQINDLVNTTAHETYHHYQMENFPTSSEKDFIHDLNTLNLVLNLDLKLERMQLSRSERGARLFSKRVEEAKRKK